MGRSRSSEHQSSNMSRSREHQSSNTLMPQPPTPTSTNTRPLLPQHQPYMPMPDMLPPQPSHTPLPHSPTTDTPLPQPLRNRLNNQVLCYLQSVSGHTKVQSQSQNQGYLKFYLLRL